MFLYLSAAVLKNSHNPQVAQHFVEYLLSRAGQRLVQDAHFLPSPALVGGDRTLVPGHLQTFLQGEYLYPG
jgi:ABC-type Fe3+ transport system substrate-binding protein